MGNKYIIDKIVLYIFYLTSGLFVSLLVTAAYIYLIITLPVFMLFKISVDVIILLLLTMYI